MARVSLIVPEPRPGYVRSESIAAWRHALNDAEHDVDVVVVSDPGSGEATVDGARTVSAAYRGRASAAIHGLEGAEGDVLIVLDPALGYEPADLPRVAGPLVGGEADLVVASRWARGLAGTHPGVLRTSIGRLARVVTGTTDPLSGLLGMTRAARAAAADRLRPVGGQFSFELLAKVEGRRLDVPVRAGRPALRSVRPGWDDIRHLKRLSDHRYGNLSRLVQFCVVGGSGMVVDLTAYYVLQKLLMRPPLTTWFVWPTKISVGLALSGALAIALALVWNFSLNRRLTFSYARSGSMARQFATYVLSNAIGVLLSFGFRVALPRKVAFFNAHRMAAAVVGIVAATGVNFSMARWFVFQNKDAAPPGG